MKKLLSLLSVLTISGTAIPTTIAASPYQKEENNENNYQQTNNLEKLSRVKRSKIVHSAPGFGGIQGRTIDTVQNNYCFLCHNRLILQIDKIDLENIFFFEETHKNNRDALFNKIFKMINDFKKENNSADSQNDDYISNSDISIIVNVFIKYFEQIKNTFKGNPKKGLIIRTNRDSYWESNGSGGGVHTE